MYVGIDNVILQEIPPLNSTLLVYSLIHEIYTVTSRGKPMSNSSGKRESIYFHYLLS